MTDEPARFRCFRCGMSFRIETPDSRAERLRCPEQGCQMRFWSACRVDAKVAKIGIDPEELAA